MSPLVSVIIPTANRPQFLGRAIQSALAGAAQGEVEVIVVPNGGDESWKQSLRFFDRDHAVRVVPIRERNANAARNTGLEHARGEWIRFLDDDDYLIPEGVRKQHEVMSATCADIVSGSIQLVDEFGSNLGLRVQPDTQEFCSAVLGPQRTCLNLAHLIRRKMIGQLRWNLQTKVRQDVEWLLTLCTHCDLHWEVVPDVVGCWFRHRGQRISTSYSQNQKSKATADMLLHAHDVLIRTGRLSSSRRLALATGLWASVHSNFFLEPRHWRYVAERAERIELRSRPPHFVYHYPVLRQINPLTLQWLFLPKRWLSHYWQQLASRLLR